MPCGCRVGARGFLARRPDGVGPGGCKLAADGGAVVVVVPVRVLERVNRGLLAALLAEARLAVVVDAALGKVVGNAAGWGEVLVCWRVERQSRNKKRDRERHTNT